MKYLRYYSFIILLFVVCLDSISITLYASPIDSSRNKLNYLTELFEQKKIDEATYLDTIYGSVNTIIGNNVSFSNKELLQILEPYRLIIWNKPNNVKYVRNYYALLSNQAQFAGREGEMLYYAKKLNDLEVQHSHHPSLTALSIITGYYNESSSYIESEKVYKENRDFFLSIPHLIKMQNWDGIDIVQSCILLGHEAEALYQLKNLKDGADVLNILFQLCSLDKHKFKLGPIELANMQFVYFSSLHSKSLVLDDKRLTLSALNSLDSLYMDLNTPNYLKPSIQFSIIDGKIIYFLNTYQSDSADFYINLIKGTNGGNTSDFNKYMINKYVSRSLYDKGMYKESIDTLIIALESLEKSRSNIVKDINDMMYARAEAENNEILLTAVKSEQSKTEKRLNWLILGTGVFSLIVLIGFKYYRQFQKSKFLEFKVSLARNIHDETGPALLYVKSLLKTLPEHPENQEKLNTQIDNTIAMIRSLSHDLKKDKLHNLDEFIVQIENLLKILNLDDSFEYVIKSSVEEKRFISDYQFSQLRLCLQELITNSLKYASFNKIFINFKTDKNKLYINYKDNGQGWDENIDYDGIGLQNIKDRIVYLNGKILINNAYPQEYSIQLEIPLR